MAAESRQLSQPGRTVALRNSFPHMEAIASEEVKGQGGGALRIYPAVRQDHV